MTPSDDPPEPPPETAESLEARYIPGDVEPRKAGTVARDRRRDLGLYSFGCALLVASAAGLAYVILQAVRAAL